MDFFAHQDRARRNTRWLVGLMVVAFVATVVLVYMLVIVVALGGRHDDSQAAGGLLGRTSWWQPDLFVLVTSGVTCVIGGGSLYKSAQLSGGGEKLAEMLGGRRLPPDARDPLERKVLNIVEEMAIASGTAVPPVYLLDGESGINAFAAGLDIDSAVIGITRGAAEQLSRDELQGVVAHEFSHILHGDMRLNLRLIAIVHGILVLGLLGYYAMRIAASSGGSRRSSNKEGGGAVAAILLLGLALMIIGYVGTFFGSLIKAAVSRQREFLADASAVQFTRNPGGISGALARIASANGSKLETPKAAEASHMFFASGLWTLFATHPPLTERIARIDASKAALLAEVLPADPAAATPAAGVAGVAGFAGGTAAAGLQTPPPTAVIPAAGRIDPRAAIDSIGDPTAAGIAYAHELLASLHPRLRDAAHDPFGCRGVVYALLLDGDPNIRHQQFELLASLAEPAACEATRQLSLLTDALPREQRLMLVDTAVGTLRNLSAQQYAGFRHAVKALVQADRRIDLFEWVLQEILLRHLDPVFGIKPERGQRRKASGRDVAVLLSCLAHAGGSSQEDANLAFHRGAEATGLPNLYLLPRDQARLNELGEAVDAIARIKPKSKRRIIEAIAATVTHDGVITATEAELLRGVADALGCPMPPLQGTATSA
jgi:Zn-dependent protease with chaperone function